MSNSIAGQIPIVASICAAGTKFRSKPTPSRNHRVTTWAAYTVSWRLRRNCPASRENGRALISRWSGVGSPSFKMARPSSITKKSQASREAPWTATKNCRDPFIFREVKKGTSPIAVLSSRQRRNRKDQDSTANDSLLARHSSPAQRVTTDNRFSIGSGPAHPGRGDDCNPQRSPRLLDWNRQQLARGTDCWAVVSPWRPPGLYAGRSGVAAIRHYSAGLSNDRNFAQWSQRGNCQFAHQSSQQRRDRYRHHQFE